MSVYIQHTLSRAVPLELWVEPQDEIFENSTSE